LSFFLGLPFFVSGPASDRQHHSLKGRIRRTGDHTQGQLYRVALGVKEWMACSFMDPIIITLIILKG
jgi:hypothetical protein